MSVVGTLPSQLEVLLPKQFVGLEGELIDVPDMSYVMMKENHYHVDSPADPLICAIPPVGVAGDMAGEDVIAKEVAEIQVPSSHSSQGWRNVLLCLPIFLLPLSSFLHRAELQARLQGGVGDVRGGQGRQHRGVDLYT